MWYIVSFDVKGHTQYRVHIRVRAANPQDAERQAREALAASVCTQVIVDKDQGR